MNWIHVLRALLWGFHHIHGTRGLFRYYVHHHAVAFLRSGVTSGSGGRGYLWWLTTHRISPTDW
jgi:hypothetical protein